MMCFAADDHYLYIVMEYCNFQDLAHKIKRYTQRKEYMDERVVWVYLIQISEALAVLHDNSVMHRGIVAPTRILSHLLHEQKMNLFSGICILARPLAPLSSPGGHVTKAV
jgi:serine/threonine protein kinase